MTPTSMLSHWMQSQRLQGPSMKNTNVFYRNLEEALDVRRKEHSLYVSKENLSRNGQSIDFSSNDFLSFGSSGRMRAEFDRELARHPEMGIGSGGSRALDGNYTYLNTVESEIARFHKAETSFILGSGFDANLALYAAVPRPGDAIVFDELSHASTYDGIEKSLATCRVPFRHNDVDALFEALVSVRETQPLIAQGKRCVLISVESVYSMEGDFCPLIDMIAVAKDVFPDGNAQFIVDEAHGTGLFGELGEGMVCELGLENEVAIRVHTFGKALATTGAVIVSKNTVKSALLNFSRGCIYTTSASFAAVAAIRSGYTLLMEIATRKARDNVQHLIKHFLSTITSQSVYDKAVALGIIYIPAAEDWQDTDTFSHILPVWTQPKRAFWLCFHLSYCCISAMPMEYPVVPKGKDGIRVTFHANNTEAEVEKLSHAICEWSQEMINIEECTTLDRIPTAARRVYSYLSDATSIAAGTNGKAG